MNVFLLLGLVFVATNALCPFGTALNGHYKTTQCQSNFPIEVCDTFDGDISLSFSDPSKSVVTFNATLLGQMFPGTLDVDSGGMTLDTGAFNCVGVIQVVPPTATFHCIYPQEKKYYADVTFKCVSGKCTSFSCSTASSKPHY